MPDVEYPAGLFGIPCRIPDIRPDIPALPDIRPNSSSDAIPDEEHDVVVDGIEEEEDEVDANRHNPQEHHHRPGQIWKMM